MGGKKYGKRDCYVECLKANEKFTAAWNGLYLMMNPNDVVIINGRHFTKRDCRVQGTKGTENTAADDKDDDDVLMGRSCRANHASPDPRGNSGGHCRRRFF